MLRILQAAGLYFAAVFGVAFALGTLRTLLLEPQVGKTMAVAIEAPLLIVASMFAAAWAPRRVALQQSSGSLLAVGFGALLFQQCADIAGSMLRSAGLAAQLAYLHSPPGLIYLAALGAFAFMPVLVWIARGRVEHPSG